MKLFRLLLVAHVAHFCYSIQDRSNDSSTWYPNLSSALYDLDLWPTDPQSWSFHALVLWLRTSRANWHLNQFINFQPIVLTSLVTDEWMDGCRQNVMPLHASLVPPYLQSSTWPHLRDWDVMLVWRKAGEYWKKKLSLRYSIVYCYNGAQRYDQFLQVGWRTVSGSDLAWFNSLSSKHFCVFCVFGLHDAIDIFFCVHPSL